MESIRQHTFTLAQYTYTALSSLRYPNGAPVVQIYSDSDFSSPEVQGPVISFNVLDDHGNVVGYSQVIRWPLGSQGLLYDRSWMVVNHNGICLSQKQEPRLCLIQPFIDLQRRIMVIKAQGMEPIEVPLEENSEQVQICQSKVCADRVNTYDCGEKISNWLSKFFGRPYHLIKQSSDFQRNAKKKHGKDQSAHTTATLSLVNEAQYLLINRSSILELQQQLSTSCENGKEELFPMNNLISRFRANIITNGTRAFEEEKWDEISIGSLRFQVLGPCHRCQMICIDQQTGQRNQDVFQKLSERRERKLDDCTLQLSHNGTYLDLEATLAEQRDELEGFQDDAGRGKKHSIILRTQLSVRVHACIVILLLIHFGMFQFWKALNNMFTEQLSSSLK
ncbi:hypothetical protein E5288_WYG007232 [Bos mutus]|uniref:MOSC domain-containing protein n=1 Tax=Bos mutus TaxID=72004 RepID=A0A6B0QS42_9CETA|nr:hypothetical protein [Bos mutus]